MADKKQKSKYQMKMKVRKSLANKVGGWHAGTKDGKRMPFALPVLLAMKAEKEARLIEDTTEEENQVPAVNSREEFDKWEK